MTPHLTSGVDPARAWSPAMGRRLVLLLVHPAGRGLLLAPSACVIAGLVVVTVAARLAPDRMPTWLDVATLLLGLSVAPAVAEPSGPCAAATPTTLATRRLTRSAAALAAIAAGWSVLLLAIPASVRPPAGLPSARLAALAVLVLAIGGATARLRSPSAAPVSGAVGATMVWFGSAVIHPGWWPLPGETGAEVVAVAVIVAVAFAALCADPLSPLTRLAARFGHRPR